MINLYDILKIANGQLFGEPAANLFTDFCLDAQNVGENQLFVALRTDRGDTHQYIEEAIQNGISGVLCVDPPTCDTTNVSVLMVNDTVDALLLWSQHTLKKLQVETIAVIGSSGKSASVDAITHVLKNKYETLAGNIDIAGKLSIPLSLIHLTAEHDYVVLKLAPAIPGEMDDMIEAVNPKIAVLMNIDCVHPATFEDCKQYTDEQAKLLRAIPPDGLVIINYDDNHTRALSNRVQAGVRVRTVSIDRFGADIFAFNVKVGIERIGFDLRYDGERYVARWSPILGKHHLYGLLAAIQIADFADIDIEDALKSLTELASLSGRMALLEGVNGCVLIDDSFAASFASTMAALDWLDEVHHDGQRTILVLGDMDNLGINSRNAHRTIGQRASDFVDYIITQGVESALSGRAAIDSGMNISHVTTTYSTQDVISALKDLKLTQQDIVLVKGGLQTGMERTVAALLKNPDDIQRLVRQETLQQDDMPLLRPSWVEIDADALASNVQIIRQNLADDVSLMAVVKADAYGHGAVLVARTALGNGAEYLGVASMAEAVELRDAGIRAPILVLTYAPAESARQAHQLDITLTVFDLEQANLYDRMARTVTGKLKVHIKLDTGMGRLGIFVDDAIRAFRHLQTLNNLEIEGIYTHFSSADEDFEYTSHQVEDFRMGIRPLRAAGINVKYTHAANSPATIANANNHFNLVRPGLILYGLEPSEKTPLWDKMRPVLSWKTKVLQVKHFPSGHPIGYGRTYHTRGNETIAILPVGYADGFRRAPNTWEYVLIHGQKAPIVGRVSMEKCAVKVTHIKDIRAGDEVVLLGQQGDEHISAEMIANWLNTSNYEVVTNIIPRVPRR
ncbi:MAG: alanine racemase [Phototrophicaceae bacterium]